MLSISHLTCAFHGKILLEDLSFVLEKGQRLDLIGMNGAGKSTLIRCLAGLIPQDTHFGWQGEILLKNKDITSYSFGERARTIAYVPQIQNLIPPFTVREFISFSRYAFDRDPNYKGIDQALEITQTMHLQNRQLITLSGGERQLVFIAAALAAEPSLLLLDEPAAFLDPAHEFFLSQLLKDLQKNGMTLIHISHNINRVLQDSTRILALKEGKILYDQNIKENKDLKWLNHTFNHDFQIFTTHENKFLII